MINAFLSSKKASLSSGVKNLEFLVALTIAKNEVVFSNEMNGAAILLKLKING